ncbi:Src2 [Thalictrum thalictroides]|uniref:Src2 n=1 Tax=Thalictrum thalictroides TaxID=46969 RepID=A0A7J6VBR4_THATH|nr:Src2 [Thalictrum thalictroides]
MEYRPLEINVISAKDLKDVNLFSKMDVYAVVSISGDLRSRQKTPVDHNSGKNPTWNYSIKFTIDENMAKQNRLILVFQLKSERSLGDKLIGEVHVPIKELLDNLGDGKAPQFVSYQVRKPDGKSKGVLNFSYKFGDKIVSEMPKYKGDEPVTAYPAYPPPGAAAGASSAAYPPPPQHGGYPPQAGGYPPAQTGGYPPAGYPPPGGYGAPPVAGYGGYPPQQGGYPPPGGYGGYPPQQGGYGGYPPQVQKPPKKNKMGMGLGAGLLGGALGGLLIGDMISDAGGYDGGYDGGFDGGGGFDF